MNHQQKNYYTIYKVMKKTAIASFIVAAILASCGNRNDNEQRIDTLELETYAEGDCDYENMSDGVETYYSDDDNLMISCWDSRTNDTIPNIQVFCTIYPYSENPVGFFLHEECCKSWVEAVHTIKKSNGTTCYLVERSYGANSWMEAYRIDHDTLLRISACDGKIDFVDDGTYERP